MTKIRLLHFLVGVVILGAIIIPGATATSGEMPDCGAVENISEYQSPGGDLHLVQRLYFNQSGDLICTNIRNKGGVASNVSFGLVVDGEGIDGKLRNLDPDDSVTITRNITSYLDVTKTNHSVEAGTLGSNPTFTFTRELNASNPEGVPSPYISNVDVVRYEQNGSSALNVSVTNPSKRPYLMVIQTETFGTDNEYNVGAPQPNETRHFRIPLKEGADETVAGKVRIFEDWGKSDGKFDQKEFVSEPGAEVQYWDDRFEEVPWANRSTGYENESMHEYLGPDVDPISKTKSRIGAVVLVLLVVGAVAWRRRRKFR